jgi:subtilisin family serine protease
VVIDRSNRIKPHISAPGTNIRSSYNGSDNDYADLSGTSTPTPHIAGAIALLWCGRPELRHDISGSRTALNEAAFFLAYKQCGTAGSPNNVAGCGRVDIADAVGTPSATPTATSIPTATPTVTTTLTAKTTPSPTPSVTPTATPSGTGQPTLTPARHSTPRRRPTPAPPPTP